MTFAVAGICPFPFVTGLPRTGIALVADTRYSWQGSRRTFDYGMKICALGSHAGCVCAGNVNHALNAISALSEFFARQHRPSRGEAARTIPSVLQAADKRLEARGASADYGIAIALVTRENKTDLLLWGPDEQLADQPDWGIVIGDRGRNGIYQQHYDERLREIVDIRVHASGFTSEPDEWIAPYAIALHDTFIKAQLTPSVGGGLQMAIVSPDLGYVAREMLTVPITTTDAKTTLGEWTRISREVTFDWRSRQRPQT